MNFPSPTSGLRPTASSLRGVSPRRGISLIEVLISMFVLMIGLLGVAAMIPAGRFEVLQGAKVDHSTMVGRAAFRDLKIRGYLNPANWQTYTATPMPAFTSVYGGGAFTATTAAAHNTATFPTPVVAIDPLGIAAEYDVKFPYNASPRYLTRLTAMPIVTASLPPNDDQKWRDAIKAVADPVFRSGDDLLFAPNSSRDFPPVQQWFKDASNKPIRRVSVGDYSWLATIVTDPCSSALLGKVTVSVAVFYKRDLSSPGAGESTVDVAQILGGGLGGGEMQLSNITKPVKPGQWMMLAGTVNVPNNPSLPQPWTTPADLKYARWYRIVAADVVDSNKQYVTLAGPDWAPTAANTTAWLFDGVIAVYEKNMKLDIQ